MAPDFDEPDQELIDLMVNAPIFPDEADRLSELPVLGEHALAVQDLPPHHRDPFDRLIIAQAMCEWLTIVTADRAFAAYDVPIMPA
jgi:PIN domain nuclease of toxin-antitoxin system